MNEQRDRIRQRMAGVLGIGVERIEDDARLVELAHSSFLLVEMIIDLQEEFDVRFGQAEMQDVHRVGQLLDLFARLQADGPQPVSAG